MSMENNHNKSFHIEQSPPDEKTICSRLAQDIPPRLAMAVPDELDVWETTGRINGSQLYLVSEVLASGTAEAMVDYLMDNLHICGPNLDADINLYGDVTDGVFLYVFRHYVYSGTAEEIINYYSAKKN